jgi:hypothetical protein
MCSWHFLQMLEYAVRGSDWTCPHFGQATATVSFFEGIENAWESASGEGENAASRFAR